MKRIFVLALSFLLLFTGIANALELVRQKNVATYIVLPIVDADGDIVTGAAGLDSEIDQWTDGGAPNGFADCTNEATEIGATGEYYLSLAQAEMNTDYIIIQVKTSTSGAKTQHILIRTQVGDPLNLATSDDGGTINVTGGAVDTVTTATATTTVNGLAAGVVTAAAVATGAIDADAVADDAIDAGAIAASAITTSELATGCISSDEIANNAIDADAIATDAIGAAEIAAAAITSSEAANLDAAITSRSTLTAANVWDTNISAYSGAGYAGTYLKGIYDKLPTNYLMGSSVVTAKDDEIDAILADTAAMDTSTELRTLLTGADTAVSTLTTADNIGINWGDVSNPTTTVGLTGTTIATTQAVASVSGAVGSVTGNVGGNVTGSVGSISGVTFPTNFNVLSISASTGLVDVTQTAADKVWGTTARTITGLTAAALADMFDTNSGTTYASAVAGSVVKEIADNAGGSALTVGAIADGVWDEARSGHTGAGTFGLYLDAQVSTVGGGTPADFWTYATRTLTAIDEDSTTLDLNATAVGSVAGAVNSVTSGVTVTTNNDKTGYGLADDAITAAKIAASAITSSEAPNLDAAVSSRSTLTTSDNIGINWADVSNPTTTVGLTGTTIATTQAVASVSGAVGSVTGNVGGNVTGSVGSVATGGITAASIATDAIGAAEVAADAGTEIGTAVWATTARLLTAGTNIALAKGVGITGFNDIAATDVWSAAARTLTALDEDDTTIDLNASYVGGVTTLDEDSTTIDLNGSTVGGLTTWDKTGYALSAAGIDAIWDEVQTGHTTALSFGKYLDAQVSTVGGGSLTVADIADGVWDELTATHTTLGSFSELLNGKRDTNSAYSDLETMIRTSR
jgi:hypothetical protein